MADRLHNPFQAMEIKVPSHLHEHFTRYCQTSGGKTVIDQSPFPRMVDLWFLALCVAANQRLEPIEVNDKETTKIIDGSIFSSDPWRIHLIMQLSIAITDDIEIVREPRKMMNLANGLAVAGLPKVVDMLKEGDAEPIWNLSEEIDTVIRSSSRQAD